MATTRDSSDLASPLKKIKTSLIPASRLCHDEILNILKFLDIGQVTKCLLVNSDWKIVGTSNMIWKPFYDEYFMNDFFEWDKQLNDISLLESNLLINEENHLQVDEDEEESEEEDDEDSNDEQVEKKPKEKKQKLDQTKKVVDQDKIDQPININHIKDKDGNINYYQLFQYDCHYPQMNESNVDLLDQLRNVDSITNVETLRSLIKHIWKDNTDSDTWDKIIGTVEMILDKSNKLWRKKPILVFTSMALLILFNKKRINYVDSFVNLTNYRKTKNCDIPILTFCKLITSNQSNLSKLADKYGIKGKLGFNLIVDNETDPERLDPYRDPDLYLRTLQDCFRIKNKNEREFYIASQQMRDFSNQDTDEFAPSFFNAGSSLSCFQSLKAEIEGNVIKIEIRTVASYV